MAHGCMNASLALHAVVALHRRDVVQHELLYLYYNFGSLFALIQVSGPTLVGPTCM